MVTAVSGIVVAVLALSGSRGEAHKPITSPFTFNEDVFPILRAQCGDCHIEGGVAPMSLLTHADAVPWGESIRAELMGGHMPPWSVEGNRGRFHNAQALTARELNVLLTWVSGGTPAGNPAGAALAAAPDPGWRLGPPDLELPLPVEFELPADTQEQMAEFTIAAGASEPLWVRAIDVRPGTPAIVRGATVRLKGMPTRTGTTMTEPVLAVWVPGDLPVALDGNAAFLLPPGAELVVSMHYKKTWEYERQLMTDRSTIGIYLAAAPAPELQRLALAPDDRAAAEAHAAAVSGVRQTPLSYTQVIQQDLLALAIYPDAALTDARVTVIAARPDGSRDELIAFRPKAGWARRYWFVEPVALPRGTVITVTARPDDAPRPPGALPPTASFDPVTARLTLNVVPAS
jgi:hypothetical protein